MNTGAFGKISATNSLVDKLICMLIISLFADYTLFDTMFIHIDAQEGLVFLFLPIYQWLAFFILLFICAAVNKFTKKVT
jgi:large-conductance mechanosensitive channel